MAYNASLYNPYGQPYTWGQPSWAQAPQPLQGAAQPYDARVRVKGRRGADAFWMPANSHAILFDEDEDIMYHKATDAAGVADVVEFDIMPRKARDAEGPHGIQYATKEDIESLRSEIDALKHPAASKSTRTVSRKASDGE